MSPHTSVTIVRVVSRCNACRCSLGHLIADLLKRYNQYNIRISVHYYPQTSDLSSNCRYVRTCVQELFKRLLAARTRPSPVDINVEASILSISRLSRPNSTTMKVGLCLYLTGGGSCKIISHSEEVQWGLIQPFLRSNASCIAEKIFWPIEAVRTRQLVDDMLSSITDPQSCGYSVTSIYSIIKRCCICASKYLEYLICAYLSSSFIVWLEQSKQPGNRLEVKHLASDWPPRLQERVIQQSLVSRNHTDSDQALSHFGRSESTKEQPNYSFANFHSSD